MASNPIKLVFDRQAQQLVLFNGSASQLPVLNAGDVRDLIVQIVDPSPTSATGPQYVAVDMSAFAMHFVIGSQPTGAVPSTILAQQNTWTWDAANKWFTAALDLTSSAVTTYLYTAYQLGAYLQVDMRLASVEQTIFQGPILVQASVDTGAVSSPAVPNLYRTAAEADNRYLSKLAILGESKIWLSADGTKAFLMYAGNDGQMHIDPINPAPAAQT